MRVADVAEFVAQFGKDLAWDFAFEFSEPWHLTQWRERRIPFENDPGPYMFTRPALPRWDIPLADNESELWYVGE